MFGLLRFCLGVRLRQLTKVHSGCASCLLPLDTESANVHWSVFDNLSRFLRFREIALDISLLTALVFAWFLPKLGNEILGAVERFGSKVATKKGTPILGTALLVI